jgi:hypothetical protein
MEQIFRKAPAERRQGGHASLPCDEEVFRHDVPVLSGNGRGQPATLTVRQQSNDLLKEASYGWNLPIKQLDENFDLTPAGHTVIGGVLEIQREGPAKRSAGQENLLGPHCSFSFQDPAADRPHGSAVPPNEHLSPSPPRPGTGEVQDGAEGHAVTRRKKA